MKIVLATPLYPPQLGGPATYAKLLVEGLPAFGIEIELVRFDSVQKVPKLLRHIAYFWRVFIASRRADAVLALDPVSTGLPACSAAHLAGKPFFVKIVGDYAWEQGKQRFGITENLDEFVVRTKLPFFVRMFRSVETRVARSAKRIIVPSEYLKHIVEVWGIESEKITVIPNAVESGVSGRLPKEVEHLAHPFVTTAGRLVPWKHIDSLIDAVSSVQDLSLVVVGDGPDRAALQKRASENLPGRNVFTGALSHEDLLAVLEQTDIFVLNSSYEGLSHVLIEALVAGCAVVATDVGGNKEVLTDGEVGKLVPFGDAAVLQEALESLTADEPLRMRMKHAALKRAEAFAPVQMLTATHEFFKENI